MVTQRDVFCAGVVGLVLLTAGVVQSFEVYDLPSVKYPHSLAEDAALTVPGPLVAGPPLYHVRDICLAKPRSRPDRGPV
jgi:hypothetical protein